jgi:hypothetical protein
MNLCTSLLQQSHRVAFHIMELPKFVQVISFGLQQLLLKWRFKEKVVIIIFSKLVLI